VIDVRAGLPAGSPRPGRRDDAGSTAAAEGPPQPGRSRAGLLPDPKGGDVFDLRGVDRDAGCLVVVRPDQHVAHVLPLDAYDEFTDFFARSPVEAVRA
jgi:hypothetical protein